MVLTAQKLLGDRHFSPTRHASNGDLQLEMAVSLLCGYKSDKNSAQ
jgi:hypothetical protein